MAPANEIPNNGTTVEGAKTWNYAAQLDDGNTGPWMGSSLYHYYDLANCFPQFKCSWAADAVNTWQTNLRQNGTQVYYYLNNFHDWLKNNGNIGFGPAQGNFQVANGGQGGLGNDAVQGQIDDGANTSNETGGTTETPAATRTRTTSTTRTWRRSRTGSRRACRCTCSRPA